MDSIDPKQQIAYLRLICLLGPVALAYLLLCIRTITYRQLTGIYLSILWCFVSLLFLNPLIIELGGWNYKVSKFIFMRTPMDLLIGWAVFWGAVPHLIKLPGGIFSWAILFMAFDLTIMPLLKPVLGLETGWHYWDLLCLLVAFVPSWFLGQWTARRRFVYLRCLMQMILFILIFSGMIPYLIEPDKILVLVNAFLFGETVPMYNFHNMVFWNNTSGFIWRGFIYWGLLLVMIVIPGLSALQEFAVRGWGTPFPLDPPVKLVTTGPYAYISNPMQVSQTLIYFWLGIGLSSTVFFLAGLMVIAFSVGYARWEEVEEVKSRFGFRALEHQSEVIPFIPRWKPWRPKPALIFLDLYGCTACSNLGRLLLFLKPTALTIKDARFYPSEDLMRMAYKDSDGFEARGIHALGRALEHVNLLWAFVGWTIRLPVISHVGQFAIDAVFPPHRVCRVPDVN